MANKPQVSIVIPLYIVSSRFFTDLEKFTSLKPKNFEILIISDKKINIPKINLNIKIVYTRKLQTGPATKRDIALKYVSGKYCAFIDDDAYPRSDWLKSAVKWFKNPDIVAVGGPGITPPTDTYWEKISGHIISSYLCSGGVQNRFYISSLAKPSFIDDWPAYNLIVRTSSLKKVGGFDNPYYGGEDTYVCWKLSEIGHLVFDPHVLVYHHRRSFPLGLIKQISNVGLHRGYFFKKYPQTSRRPIYLLPSLLTLFIICQIVSSIILPDVLLLPNLIIFALIVLISTISILRHKVNLLDSIISGMGVIIVHIAYGIYFIKGLCISRLSH